MTDTATPSSSGAPSSPVGASNSDTSPSFGLAPDTGAPGAGSTDIAPVVPGSADAYMLELPADFEAPFDGFEFTADPNDPITGEVIGEARAMAHELGLSQEQFSKMLSLAAKRDVAEYRALQDASKREMESLGVNGAARVDAITKFLVGHLGETSAKSLLGTLFTKAQVEAYERLMKTFTSRGVPTPRSGMSGGNSWEDQLQEIGNAKSATERFMIARDLDQKQQRRR